MATTSCIQLEARKVSDPVLFIRPDSEDAIFVHDIVASLNFLPQAVLILFQGGDRSRPWMRRIKKERLLHVCADCMPGTRYACLSWSDDWFIVLLPASDHNQAREHERRLH